MADQGAFGAQMASHLHLDSAPVLTVKTHRKAQLALTRLRSETGLPQMTTTVRPQKAFIITIHLRDLVDAKLWIGQRLAYSGSFSKGAVGILDLEEEPTSYTADPFDCLQLYLSRTALEEVAYDHGSSRIDTLIWQRGKVDANVNHLALSLLPAIERTEQASKLFIDQVMLALLAYCAHTYGRMDMDNKLARGGLAPWQIRRATELLRERLDGEVSLSEVAAECELSVSHFARSFKRAVGQTPYRWLIDRRLEAAKQLMLNSALGLSEIALGCGFSDQASFSRTFKRVAGTSPGDWRRSYRH